MRDWSEDGAASWSDTGAANGPAQIEIDARAVGSFADYEATTLLRYEVTGGTPACRAVTLGASPVGQATVGAPATFTADASCDGGDAEYRFWVRTDDTDWTIARDYDAAPAFALDTGAYRAGAL